MEVPIDGGLIQQLNMIAGRNAAEGSHTPVSYTHLDVYKRQFQTKGSVGQVARELHISEPTVYRYLRRIRSETS